MILKNTTIDTTWTLFLDRDGVINRRIENDYVKILSEFEFLEGVVSAIQKATLLFGKIIVVTNQQGIGKGIYTEMQLHLIHSYMLDEIEKQGGKITKVYHSPHLASENHTFRKPNIGMALQAKKEFLDIDFSKSIMIGDSMSDMDFGKNAGMKTIFISDENIVNDKIDACFPSLLEAITYLQKTTVC
ncbi:MAG: HAD family hydrolase [Bacteroidetes bacterium]|nr:HAD family hydrolase [Bacteroidota bacterium]